MLHFFSWLFSQYTETPTYLIVLEIIGAFFSVLSVIYSKKNNILVFPTGIIGTLIYTYILAVYGLLGDMLINAYYFVMSIYGWIIWTRKPDDKHVTPITRITKLEKKKSIWIFFATMISVALVYQIFNRWQNWYSYTDIITTAIFFVGQWLMAKKKIENWLYWIVGDSISVPLYFLKGLVFSSILYITMTILAVFGYKSWKKLIGKKFETI